MSLFFLHLSLLTYLLTHFWARKAKPIGQFQFNQNFVFAGTQKEFMQQVQNWVAQNPRLDFIELKEESCIVSEKPKIFSYGYFYHFETQKNADNTEVKVKAEARFISAPGDKKVFEKNLSSDLDLEKAA